MADEITKEMHKIRAKLYPNYLPGGEGTFIARTQTEATLSVEKVCIAATTRGGAVNSYEVMVNSVNDYFDEALYQLKDGFSVENKLCSIHPKLGGLFNKLGQLLHPLKRTVDFSFRTGSALRNAGGQVEVVIEGLADTSGYIGRVEDIDSETIDQDLTPGGNIVIEGHKIKVDGDNADVGVYFADRSGGTRVKVAKRLAENRDAKIIAVVPSDIPAGVYRLEIVTQYNVSSIPLKEPRTIVYDVDLTVH
jgi:hypothetical protein